MGKGTDSGARRPPSTAGDAAAQDIVILVDDDPLMLSALRRVLLRAGFTVEAYESAAEMLAQARLDRPACVVSDMVMPHMTGLELQACLKQRGVRLPLLYLSGASDLEMAVQAMREGAVDFLEKPFDNDDLVRRVRRAIEQYRFGQRDDFERHDVARKLKTLTPRESRVSELVVAGKTNKEIARSLGSSHRTIEVHRRNVMEKMAASSLADLVRMCLLGDNGSRST
jgi:FixJ family two-component response regulator